ncbi:MbcA/ParS/Xre antitoxin family protein [Methylotenera sp.]|uniref:MbcA/ParS/Xre antitoxin family protein n=1 Tax=Methylotenera sp. TaxID=2051956 RepID=UPI002EDB62DF
MTTKSDLQLRIDELETMAIETFGSKTIADVWLHRENFVLGATPIYMAESDSGLMEVKKILSAINYGGVV